MLSSHFVGELNLENRSSKSRRPDSTHSVGRTRAQTKARTLNITDFVNLYKYFPSVVTEKKKSQFQKFQNEQYNGCLKVHPSCNKVVEPHTERVDNHIRQTRKQVCIVVMCARVLERAKTL